MGKATRVARQHKRYTETSKPRPGQEGFEPIRVSSSPRSKPDSIHLFSIDDKDFYVAGFISAALALRMLEVEADEGEAKAVSYVMAEVLGEEGYSALLNCDGLEPSEMTALVKIVVNMVMGTLEDESGK